MFVCVCADVVVFLVVVAPLMSRHIWTRRPTSSWSSCTTDLWGSPVRSSTAAIYWQSRPRSHLSKANPMSLPMGNKQ